MIHSELHRLSRRALFRWFLTASAAMQINQMAGLSVKASTVESLSKGYGSDPKVAATYNPGDFWPLTLPHDVMETVKSLADILFPEDHLGPAASALRVPDFIHEWLSAPYPHQINDRDTILPGLRWINQEAKRRFGMDFPTLTPEQHHSICDDIAWLPDAKPEFREGAEFFARFRNLESAAYYGTPEGWKAIGYVGNTPLARFDGPPQEVLEKLGVKQILI